jgi:Uma2 family endonuclease
LSIAIEPEAEIELPERYEVINGEIVEALPTSWCASEVANLIRDEVAAYAKASHSGRCRNDMMFHVPFPADPTRNRRPDIAFITFDRWPADRALPYRGEPADVVPDLMVEVASPNDKAEELLSKEFEYLEAGARLVWLAYPALGVDYAYESSDSLRRFKIGEELDGGSVLPGFHVPMANLFPTVTDFDVPSDE